MTCYYLTSATCSYESLSVVAYLCYLGGPINYSYTLVSRRTRQTDRCPILPFLCLGSQSNGLGNLGFQGHPPFFYGLLLVCNLSDHVNSSLSASVGHEYLFLLCIRQKLVFKQEDTTHWLNCFQPQSTIQQWLVSYCNKLLSARIHIYLYFTVAGI